MTCCQARANASTFKSALIVKTNCSTSTPGCCPKRAGKSIPCCKGESGYESTMEPADEGSINLFCSTVANDIFDQNARGMNCRIRRIQFDHIVQLADGARCSGARLVEEFFRYRPSRLRQSICITQAFLHCGDRFTNISNGCGRFPQ